MTSLPQWPYPDRARVLTLAGNDLSIDTRARKTASSLARAGYSVISVGIDWAGLLREEQLDGALLTRVIPPADPRASVSLFRLSAPIILDRLKYRVEIQRQRLQMERRLLSAWIEGNRSSVPRWGSWFLRAQAGALRRVGVDSERRASLTRRLEHLLNRLTHRPRVVARRFSTVFLQRRHQATTVLYKALHRFTRSISPARGSWRRHLPEQFKFEVALGSLIDYLEPDLIHVHDIFHLGVAARAKARALQSGRRLRVLYDAQEFIPGLPSDARRRAAYTDLEEEFIGDADAVVTVSRSLAELLSERYRVEPIVVMNAPDIETMVDVRSIREVVGLTDSERIVVYVGGVAPHRGAELLVEAVGDLEEHVHLIFVTNSTTGYVADLMAKASEITSRVHLAPYVAPESVVPYIRSADVSVIPLNRDVVNYEVALPNKLFQSIHAGVPVVVSDNPEMARFVTERGVGEIFRGGDVDSLTAALSKVLTNRAAYRAPLTDKTLLDELSWKRQATVLIDVYESLGVKST